MALPTQPLPQDIDLSRSRMLIHSLQGSGKTQLMSGWYPKTTLVVDFDDSWRLLPGDHFRVTPKSFAEVHQLVVELTTTKHQFTTVIIDTVTRMWRLADLEAGSRYGKNAAGVVEYGKGTSDRDGTIMRAVAPLFASPLGVILLAHSRLEGDDDDQRYFPQVDKKIYDDLVGGVDFVFFLDRANPEQRVLLTHPNKRAECKTRLDALPLELPVPNDSAEAAQLLHAEITAAAKIAGAPTAAVAEAKAAA